ncbi:glutathione S-transferase N-terminal domain-containing protein [Aestuariispira insulae]|uniref:GST-like protein n=1 Tax=Aestuariispira insulae TaxID=1461337 RepID=A0A3D9H5R9_9PROT|nr:glutathione S-transferase N-terminal domain-containing protein [Aestuariispira insulae]RED44834.1 GST-like protein [Aestuariispira insulae]
MNKPLFATHWPAANPDILQLYSLATPNGQKVSVMLEELGLEYEPHTVNILQDDQFTEEFKQYNPNSKIPAIKDPNGPGGQTVVMMESGAILLYLAEKTGKFIPADPVARNECIQWLFFQMASIGPMFGQFGHFHKFAREACLDPYPLERYSKEARRLLGVLETRLADHDYIMGSDYSIADIATFPWVRILGGYYEGAEQLQLSEFKVVNSWLERCLARPAVQRGLVVCGLD